MHQVPFRKISMGLAFLLVAATAWAGEATRTVKLELSPDAVGKFAVENLAGTMRVLRGSGDRVVAVATMHAESEDLAAKMQFRQVTGEKGLPTLRVEYPLGSDDTLLYQQESDKGHHGFLSGMFSGSTSTKYAGRQVKVSSTEGIRMHADVEIQLPPGDVQGTFRNLVGHLRGEGVEGKLFFDSASGDITLREIKGQVKADSGSGDVKADDLEGSFTCDTGSGGCTLNDFKGEKVSCDVGSGDVRLKTITAQSLVADTGSGDVDVDAADIEIFSADTGSGDVTLITRGNRLTKVKADTGSGDVVLRLAPEASFEALADQGSGDLRVAYKDAEPILKGREVIGYRRGDSKIRIDVNTGSGDLQIEPVH